jgi:predicted Mrr-cat superfamily restriction endonuclease
MAEATDVELYSQDAYGLDLANQRKVVYKRDGDVPVAMQRNFLSEGLQRRLKVMGRAVSNLNEFGDEIEKIFAEFKEMTQSFDALIRKKEKNEEEKFKEDLLNRIQNGKTYLQTGGRGLEELVCELMRCEGYESKILSKRAFPNSADADIESIKEDSFVSQKFLVQVKHHHGYSGEWGLLQLNAIKEMNDEKYLDYNYMLITSAMIDENVKNKALEMDVDVKDGRDLVDLIYNNIEKLSPETKRKLGISLIPHLNE